MTPSDGRLQCISYTLYGARSQRLGTAAQGDGPSTAVHEPVEISRHMFCRVGLSLRRATPTFSFISNMTPNMSV
ncbi:uncharacterized protein SPSK_03770 [Sporothrix schenckii 1099-18]|uniref:Uncharacterized protein n=1 Tax=Sporothrix schenckii 1099-18 TaxID=1397361 RepID=A0A0F2LX08_SPOSC|nr:uncharacterized protein SPSK_03770 [Sporothrix schenckii 1099-18]KJR81987.1 hypothetical protein SPSK_03770 [Sporothrix schenckii 1099-18]